MRVPLSWLRDFTPIDAPVDHLAAAFSDLGLVVEGVERVGTGLDGVVVARVLAVRRHPDADRIQLVDVDEGDGAARQIVCGAFNVGVGDLVPLATIGTVLPDGTQIRQRKMRNEWSSGMLCSASELGLPEQTSDRGLLILPRGAAAPGTPLTDALGLEPDVVFDLDISPNRPDALSIVGVARDIAAALGSPFELPTLDVPVDPSIERASVEVLAGDLCPRFTATVLTGFAVGPSPTWISRRLTLCGMRSISNVVDVSNYVMLELGQPNHAYDLDRLADRGLSIRRARRGETLVTLDNIERCLEADDCLICDAVGTAVGIGGVMGGAYSEISEQTETILLEAAYFNPMAIARTGKRLALHTEARHRFERGCDPAMIDRAIDRFASLLPGKTRGATVDVRSAEHLPGPRRLPVRTGRVNALLGTSLTSADIGRLLASIGFTSSPLEGQEGVLEVSIPTWRPDSEREVDVIEEIARLHGYPRIERSLPAGIRAGGGWTRYQGARRRVRDMLVGAGVSEAWTTTFLAPGDLERAGLPADAVGVENPLDQSESLLRTSLLPGLLKAVRFNADRQEPDARLFEIGHVFWTPDERSAVQLPREGEHLAIMVAGEGADAVLATRLWAVLADGLRLDGVRLSAASVPGMHPTRTARITAEETGEVLGAVGEVDPTAAGGYGVAGRVGFLTVDLERLLGMPRRPDQAAPISRFPASEFDLAFVVPEDVPAADVRATLARVSGDWLERVQLFDVYRGPQLGQGRRSLAYRIRLRAPDRTLTDAEVAGVRRQAIDAVTAAHRGQLRS